MEFTGCGGLGKKVLTDANYRWEIRRAYENGQTREQWLASKSALELTRLKVYANAEPVGLDAILHQIAKIAHQYMGGRFEDYSVLKPVEFQQTEDEIFAALDKVLPKRKD